MKRVTIKFDKQSGRVLQEYWDRGQPDWTIESGYKVAEVITSESEKRQLLADVEDSLESGVDYDPDNEEVKTELHYDDSTSELYAEAEIKPLNV